MQTKLQQIIPNTMKYNPSVVTLDLRTSSLLSPSMAYLPGMAYLAKSVWDRYHITRDLSQSANPVHVVSCVLETHFRTRANSQQTSARSVFDHLISLQVAMEVVFDHSEFCLNVLGAGALGRDIEIHLNLLSHV